MRQSLGVAVALGALTAALALMIDHALRGGDWPGWDEGWVLVVFPLGLPGPGRRGRPRRPERPR